MAKIKVIADSYTETTRLADPDERWDGDDTYTDWTFNGIELVGENNWYDLTTTFKPKQGTIYYLLVAVYSTGDSFSRNDGANVDYVGLYRNETLAAEMERKIDLYDASIENNVLIITLDNGKKMNYPVPWAGYFESLDSIQVIPVTI